MKQATFPSLRTFEGESGRFSVLQENSGDNCLSMLSQAHIPWFSTHWDHSLEFRTSLARALACGSVSSAKKAGHRRAI